MKVPCRYTVVSFRSVIFTEIAHFLGFAVLVMSNSVELLPVEVADGPYDALPDMTKRIVRFWYLRESR